MIHNCTGTTTTTNKNQILIEDTICDACKGHHSPDIQTPAYIVLDTSGAALQKIWYSHGMQHRENDLPAVINYYPIDFNRTPIDLKRPIVRTRAWMLNDCYCRRPDDEPNFITYHKNGQINTKCWYNTLGQVHREDGPSLIIYNHHGKLFSENYSINNIEYPKEKFIERYKFVFMKDYEGD